ncbi:MAG: class I SAM-dependent DNA methyltransferase [Tannerellaceae bacterium]
MSIKNYNPRDGYNHIAYKYDEWKWQIFWHLNEYPYIIKWCENLKIGSGLDLGVGSGNNLECFIKKGHKILAIDISEKMINICKSKYPSYIANKQLTCIETDLTTYTSHDKFDWIISNRVFSHVKQLDKAFKIITETLNNEGEIFISDIHPNHNYKQTSMNINEDKIVIETYKHTINTYKELIYRNNLEITEFKEIYVYDLLDKSILDNFPNIKNQTQPILFYFILKKR